MPRLINIFQKKRNTCYQPVDYPIGNQNDYPAQFEEVETFHIPYNGQEHPIRIIRTTLNNLPTYFAIGTKEECGTSFYFTDHHKYIYYHPNKDTLKKMVMRVVSLGRNQN